MVNLTCNILVLIWIYFNLVRTHVAVDLQLELLCMHLERAEGQEEPGWHWRRAESFPNSHGFRVFYVANVVFSRMSVLTSK